MKKTLALLLACAMLLVFAACSSPAPASAPADANAAGGAAEQTVTSNASGGVIKVICPYGVGGTADAIARKYALVAGKVRPEYDFIVENMTGGDGFAAASYYTEADASTKELLVYGYGVAYRHDLGVAYETEVVDFDRSKIYPVATVDDRTWILYSTPGVTMADIIAQSTAEGVKMSGGNPLSDPHLALGSLLALGGGKVMVVPYDGGANQKKALTDGEVDVFVGTTQAGQEEVEAGTITPILAFSETPFEGFVSPSGPITVPCIAGDGMDPALDPSVDYTISILPAGGFIATRVGADQAWIDELVQISKDVWADPEYSDWINSILLNKLEIYGADAQAHLEDACAKAINAFDTLS